MGKAAATTAAAQYFDSGQFQAELAAMVAHPTTSQVAGSGEELSIYLSEQIKPRLDAMDLMWRCMAILILTVGRF